ncbi:MAG: hypothetical protein EOL88_01600 [Bacteroidia bacterium]|nr:hypothetical protein [Bacteroidia bacterium]
MHDLPKILFSGVAVLAVIIVFGWFLFTDPVTGFTAGVPGADREGPPTPNVAEEVVDIGAHFEYFRKNKSPESLIEHWPRFRGVSYDNISRSERPLLDSFPDTGPKIMWQHTLGEGHAGAALYAGMVYLMDYDEKQRADMLHCYDLVSGEEVWRRWYNVNVKRNHGMSRTVPAVSAQYILTIGPKCHVMCLERTTGDLIWTRDVAREYASEIPLWYTGQCPLIDNGEAVIATGGKALMVGIDCRTGKTRWETPNPAGWKMSHSSVMPYTFKGKAMYVYAAVGAVFAVSAADHDKGTLLWASTEWNQSVVAPSAVCMPDGKIFLTAGYGAGSLMLQLKYENGIFSTEVLDVYKPREGLACEQQTPVYFNNHLIGVAPKDAGALRNQLICTHSSNTRNIVWSSGKESRFGLGPYMIADGKIFLLNDDGTLYIMEASTDKYKELSRYQLMEGHDAWAPLALANGFMVLRDATTLMCIDLNNM